jgi:hypothetical protein
MPAKGDVTLVEESLHFWKLRRIPGRTQLLDAQNLHLARQFGRGSIQDRLLFRRARARGDAACNRAAA